MTEHTVEIDNDYFVDEDYEKYLTPLREAKNSDEYAQELPPGPDDVSDEEALADRDDWDDDDLEIIE